MPSPISLEAEAPRAAAAELRTGFADQRPESDGSPLPPDHGVAGVVRNRLNPAPGNRGDTLLKIRMEDINNSPHGPYFCGPRQRLASATSVKFIGDNRLVTTNCVGQRMYLIRFDLQTRTHAIDFCLPTTFAGRPVCTDLIDFDGRSLIAAGNCDDANLSLYRLEGDRIEYLRDVTVDDQEVGFVHGVKFMSWRPDLLGVVSMKGGRYIYFVDHESGQVAFKFRIDGWTPKDISFVDERTLVLVSTNGLPRRDATSPYESKISLIRFDLDHRRHEILDEVVLANANADACEVSGNLVYLGDQMQDSVSAYSMVDDRLEFEWAWGGFSFVHGLDVHDGLQVLAATCYGDNSIVIRKL